MGNALYTKIFESLGWGCYGLREGAEVILASTSIPSRTASYLSALFSAFRCLVWVTLPTEDNLHSISQFAVQRIFYRTAIKNVDSHSLLLSRFSHVRFCVTPYTATHQAPPSLVFSRQEHWSGLPLPSPMHEIEKGKWSHSVVSDSLQPHGLYPTRLLRPWHSPGKNTAVHCHCLLCPFSDSSEILVWKFCIIRNSAPDCSRSKVWETLLSRI